MAKASHDLGAVEMLVLHSLIDNMTAPRALKRLRLPVVQFPPLPLLPHPAFMVRQFALHSLQEAQRQCSSLVPLTGLLALTYVHT